ncbi:uncharacterized protein LOC110024779 isoform X2 [Phalaenopsis equestris]|uniref:uncharacterized protein LOC110024779 isoform X2 n=1 Tax=Phalaenopsis equestris TaxID=78828 RepID=UPI0009E59706|nr:uncharacterized protein LOC110024779 isoform X2 [Phalaenopsis equestris]
MNVDEEVGRLKEEIQRLGQSQPDGSFKVVSSAKKFKISGIDPVLEEKLDMFSRVVSMSPHSFTPSEQGFISLPEVMGTE